MAWKVTWKQWWYRQRRKIRLILLRLLRILQVNEYTFIFAIAAFVGVLSGGIGGFIRVWFVESYRWVWSSFLPNLGVNDNFRWIVFMLAPAVGALLLYPLIKWRPDATYGHHGIPFVMEKIALGGGVIPPYVIPLRTIATTFTIASGGSAGRESPVVQIGASIGSWVGQILHLHQDKVKVLLGCGASAGIAAVFDTPLAGVMFSLELLLGEWTIMSTGPLIISAVFAVAIERILYKGTVEIISVPPYVFHSLKELIFYFLTGIICGILAWLFIVSLNTLESFLERIPNYLPLKLFLGGLIVGILGLMYPEIRGSQYEPIAHVFSQHYLIRECILLFLFKMIATLATLGSGASGGELAPSLFMGAMIGSALGLSFQAFAPAIVSPGVYALAGMVAFTGAIMHAPMTLMLMAVELTKTYSAMLPMMVAVLTATVVARSLNRDSLYTAVLRNKGILFYLGRDENILKQLKVRHIMRHQVTAIPYNARFRDVVSLLLNHPGMYFPVIDEDHRVIGLISLDELKTYLHDESLHDVVIAEDIANEAIPVIHPDDDLVKALEKMNLADLDELPVTEGGRLEGMVTRRDILKAYQKAIIEKKYITHDIQTL